MTETPEDKELKVYIATTIGFVNKPKEFDCHGEQGVVDDWYLYDKGDILRQGLPDFINDHNAMHWAYQYLKSISRSTAAFRQPDDMFQLHLMQLVNPGKQLWDNGTFLGSVYDGLEIAEATCRQKAQAFKLTMEGMAKNYGRKV